MRKRGSDQVWVCTGTGEANKTAYFEGGGNGSQERFSGVISLSHAVPGRPGPGRGCPSNLALNCLESSLKKPYLPSKKIQRYGSGMVSARETGF